jgi:hypothetical protein
MSATLRLMRAGFGIELRRGTFDVLVDGRNVGTIEMNGRTDVRVSPGHHTLQLRKDRYSSRPRPFDVRDGETVAFQAHGTMVWPRYVASIVKPDLAIVLRRK